MSPYFIPVFADHSADETLLYIRVCYTEPSQVCLQVERELIAFLGNANDDHIFAAESFVGEKEKNFNPLVCGDWQVFRFLD